MMNPLRLKFLPVGENPLVTWSNCSYDLQDHPCEFNLIDQNGNEFSLYDHMGKVIVLDFSTMWCPVCKMIAPNSQIIQDTYEDQNFVYITILIDDQTGSEPGISDIYSWSSQYGMTSSPVLIGNRSLIDPDGESGWQVSSWPTFFIINRDMITEFYLPGWNESVIVEEIESLL
jgi:thiol-disulfide isomerase/thioredoxin